VLLGAGFGGELLNIIGVVLLMLAAFDLFG
jgi:hypothetical protein